MKGRLLTLLGASALAVLLCSPTRSGAAEAKFVDIPGSLQPTTDTVTGELNQSAMSVEVLLAPSNEPALHDLLANLYDSQSNSYRQWLKTGEFNERFAPSAAQSAAVTDYLRGAGLQVESTSSPFLIRATGPSSTVEAAFKTTILKYQNRRGVSYYSNSTTAKLPPSLASAVRGVVGLSNTVRLHSHAMRPMSHGATSIPNCEAPYVTTAQLYAAVNDGTSFPFGYGGAPGCNGLTPSQVNSIYSAPDLGDRAKGAGVEIAVFELSAYQSSDIDTWVTYFYGKGYKAPLVNITVDGGPTAAICPAGDECPAEYNFYSGDIEVDADIEVQLAVAPAVRHLLVYEAPNDFTGQTELDNYSKIANDNRADAISSSWGECENDSGAAYAMSENLLFQQLAAQGQSMFASAGDTGAFECIRSDGTTLINQGDPSSQPWVTSVGGTSFESFNPNANPFPSYPMGIETVWNVDDLCNASANEGGSNGFFWCGATGAGGGGFSQFWGRPSYQNGPGVNNSYTAYGNGTTQCALAAEGTPCREVPDVAANADEYTPYAEYCTANASTPYSSCGFSSSQTPAGWFGIGGTSLSSPLWSAIIADHIGFWQHRIGNANPLLYALHDIDANAYFHDISGRGQSTNNNGLFPTTPGYDMATGIGTPKMNALITLFPDLF